MAGGDAASAVADLLRRRDGLYQGLLAEADRLLAAFGSADESELVHAPERRQELLDSIQKIDAEIAARIGRSGCAPPPAVRGMLDEAAARRRLLTDRILEKDSLVAALANGRIEEIRRELGGLSRGRSAVQAYESGAINLAG